MPEKGVNLSDELADQNLNSCTINTSSRIFRAGTRHWELWGQ
jgi:hypothetical protein